jgi:AcrR family transcriptional regulator
VTEPASLRDQQAEFTKQLLLEAARKVISETDPEDFTMQKVAQEAGVSHRTVYRYFPNRQALIDEFSEWLETRFQNKELQSMTLDDIQELTYLAFRRFDRNAAYFEAAARLSGGSLRPSNQEERTALIREAFDQEFPDMDPAAADESFAVIRLLIGLQTWYELRDRFKLGDGETAEAVSWAVGVLFDALKEGNIPKARVRSSDGAEP